ncbi:MAG: hypothetical protein HY811_06050 [Planctomycetes bacterium]|nr:hypothetical protein [Planctomycetota bacterium]
MFTDSKKLFVLSVLLIIAWVFTYAVIIESIKETNAELKSELENNRAKVGSIISRAGGIDDSVLKKISEEQKRIEGKLSKIKEKTMFRPRPEYTVDLSQPDLLIKFNVLLGTKYSRLKKVAAAKEIKFPASFGFPTENITVNNVPSYFEKLDVIDRILTLAIEKGCQEIISINMEKGIKDFLDAGLLDNGFFKTDLVVIKLKAKFKSAAEIIYALTENMAEEEGFLSIPRISLESADSEADLLTMTLAAGVIKKISGNQ